MNAFKYYDELYSITCGACGVVFAIPTRLREGLLESHQTFYCPNGHPRAYTGKSEAEKLREELERERRRREMAEREAAMEAQRANAADDKLRRVEKRVSNGVCPCCNRTFQNLARHMKTKHPEQVA